ncbi:hypothetical protein [Paenibacillus sp. Marseille-Q4541]|uniref:hypothetical protein n=1 Tax=Paenibacillus sp. Marseille-Q4541 TaxID=2831522 RepID=UPI001BA977DC|nr:hypothetical protein [Paenibacillus sp. Marseille-Q4541]
MLVITVLIILGITEDTHKSYYLSNGELLGIIVVVGYIVLGGLGFIQAANNWIPTKTVYGWENKIVAMSDSSSYVVSRHSVDRIDRYYYMVDYGDYSKSHWVNQNYSRIIQTEDIPKVVTYIQERQATNWFLKDMNKVLKLVGYDDLNLPKRYDFYVPKGTVISEYKIDME